MTVCCYHEQSSLSITHYNIKIFIVIVNTFTNQIKQLVTKVFLAGNVDELSGGENHTSHTNIKG